MTVSRVKGLRLPAAALAVLLSGLAAAALAQTPEGRSGQPVRLVPPKAAGTPVPEPAKSEAAPTAPTAVADPVQVDTLGAINLDAAGLLGDQQGGLGTEMWKGTPRALVESMLPRLPARASSAGVRDLMRRLLLTQAVPPEGKLGAPGKGLIELRIERLAAMGDAAGVVGLLRAVPGRGDNAEMARLEADTLFLANDNARACTVVAQQVTSRPDPYWQKAFVFCQALAGEHAKASLGLALLRETGDKDPIYFALMDSLVAGIKPALKSLPQPTPLLLAMARAAKAQLPADATASDSPALLRAVAISSASPELRLDAAERAEAAGALDTELLRQLYASLTFSDQDIANPLSRATPERGAVGRALLYRTAVVQTVPLAKAEVAARALVLAREGGRYLPTVRVFMPVLKSMVPANELLWFAPEAARAMLVAGDADGAAQWIMLLRSGALFSDETAAVLAGLKPLAHLAGMDAAVDWKPEDLSRWWEGESKRAAAGDRASLLFGLIEALGEPTPEALWDALLDGPQLATAIMPRPALWNRLRRAANAKRVGETVMLALIALGDGGLDRVDPVTLHRVTADLNQVGLQAEARALALEAAVAAGL